MLSEEAIKTIRNALKFKYDEHVSRLLAISEKNLSKIVPNKGLPIIEILEGHNADTAKEVRRYGEVLQSEIARMIEKLVLKDITEEDKEIVLLLLEDYCSPDLYKKRFVSMLSSIERKIKSYGIAFDITNYRIGIPQSRCDVDAENSVRKIKAIISNELNCHIVRNQSKSSSEIDSRSVQVTAQISKLTALRKIWTDPVLSKVIATIIIAIGGLCWAWLHNKSIKNNGATLRVPSLGNSSFTNISSVDRSRFIRDGTFPNNEQVTVNQVFEKIWEIQNIGGVVWKNRYLQREGVSNGAGVLKSVDRVKIPFTKPGDRAQIKVVFQAPSLPCTTTTYWKMVDESGRYLFPNQKALYVTVQVVY